MAMIKALLIAVFLLALTLPAAAPDSAPAFDTIVPMEHTLADIMALDPGTELHWDANFSAVSVHYTEDGAKVLVYYYKVGTEPDEYLVERVLIEGTPEWDEFYEKYAD